MALRPMFGIDHTELPEGAKRELLAFELNVRRQKYTDSLQIALATLKVIRESYRSAKTVHEVKRCIKTMVSTITEHFPHNTIIINASEHVQPFLFDEIDKVAPKTGIKRSPSRCFLDIIHLENSTPETQTDNSVPSLIQELDGIIETEGNKICESYSGFVKHGETFLHSGSYILTVGFSNSVLSFLTKAPKDTVIFLPERAPFNDGIRMHNRLKERHIHSVLISDSSIMAIMPKITTILLPVRAVVANGAIISYSLAYQVAIAAQHYAKPVLALCWDMKKMKKIKTPGIEHVYIKQPTLLSDNVCPTDKGPIALNTEGDWIPPEMITLIISDVSMCCPADIYQSVMSVEDED